MPVYSIANGFQPIKRDGLKLGQHVSYGDYANDRRTAVVIEEKGGPYGQRCVFMESMHFSTVSLSDIEGLGGWRMEDGTSTPEEIADLVAKAHEKQREAQEKRKREEDARKAKVQDGERIYRKVKPKDAQAVLVAKYEQDVSDSQIDYFAIRTTKVVLLMWSTHTRDLFPEMRKAAALYPDTKFLADAPKGAEHREKWSMGKGYYLHNPDTRGGWTVCKWDLHPYNMDGVYLALSEGRYVTAGILPPGTGQMEEKAEKTEGIRIEENAQFNGLEIYFPGKPDAAVLELLKSNGWRWHRQKKCWYHRNTDANRQFAESL